MKSRRNKDVPCLLCGENTRDVDAVCGECRRQRILGKEVKSLQDKLSPYMEVATVHQYVRLWSRLGVPVDSERTIMRLIMELVGAVRTTMLTGSGPVVGNVRPEIDRTYESYHYYWLVPTGRAKIMQELVEAIRDLAAYNYNQGYQAGDRLLTRIANDELSVSQINAATDKRK